MSIVEDELERQLVIATKICGYGSPRARGRRRWVSVSLPCRLRRLTATVGRRLISHARVVRAIGQAGERLAAAEKEFGTRGIADRPVAGGLAEFEQRQPLAHRHDIVEGDRVGFHLDFKGMGERGVAARHRPRHPHHLLGGARLARPRRCRGRALGAAGQAQPVYFADHRVSRHVAEFGCDLTGRKAAFPEFFQLLDAIVGPGQYRHRNLPFASRRPNAGSAGDAKSQISLQAESLSPRRARKARPNVYAEHKVPKRSEPPHEMSYPTARTLQYGVTPAQESVRLSPHVPSPVYCRPESCG